MLENIPLYVDLEKFAAYLDGNLSEEEMHTMKENIKGNEMLQEVFNLSQDVDLDVAAFENDNMELPQTLATLDFSLPLLVDEDTLPDIDVTPIDMCAYADVGFTEIHQEADGDDSGELSIESSNDMSIANELQEEQDCTIE